MKGNIPDYHDLLGAILERKFVKAERMLERVPGLLHERSSSGETVLFWLAIERDIEGVEWLHSHGASIDISDCTGDPLLFQVASDTFFEKSFRWLIANGVDLRAINDDGLTLREYLAENGYRRRIPEIDRIIAENR